MDPNDKREDEVSVSVANIQAETIQRYGQATGEHVAAYIGQDSQTHAPVAKGLRDISKSRLNPEHRQSNIKQQAGFSAEVKTTARENAERILEGRSAHRTVRTDDMARQSDGRGHMVGGANEQLYDVAAVDAHGIYIEGSARQLKFIGGDPQQCARKLLGKKFDKYRDADVPIEIPSDFFDSVETELAERGQELEGWIANAESKGDTILANKHRQQLEKVNKTRGNIRKGKVSNQEAIEARLHPMLSTAKDMARISHRAGLQGAQMGATVGGSISFIHNSVAVIKGDISAEEAVVTVVEDTAKAAASSYVTNYASTQLIGIMGNAPSQYLQALSKTNLPATMVVAVTNVGKTLVRYGKGEIDGTDCLIELGETGAGMLASSAGAVVGQVLIPIPVVGGLVGSMVGYAMSSAYYGYLVSNLKEAKLAHERRLEIEAECRASIAAIQEYRLQIELAAANYLRESMEAFSAAFVQMEEAYNTGNANAFILGTNMITKQLGGSPLFEGKPDFDKIMRSTETIVI